MNYGREELSDDDADNHDLTLTKYLYVDAHLYVDDTVELDLLWCLVGTHNRWELLECYWCLVGTHNSLWDSLQI